MNSNNQAGGWRTAFALMAIGMLLADKSSAVTTTTVSFQNGVNGYTGTFDRYISDLGPVGEATGSAVQSYNLSGFNATTSRPDQQGLIRFDNIFGNGPGQIPTGAFILDASLQLATIGGANADTNVDGTGGPYGVAGLLTPFDATTSYFTSYPSGHPSGGRGAWFEDDHATRPAGGFGAQRVSQVSRARVTSIVQQWSDGELDNNGLVVQAGFDGVNDDSGWRVLTTGYSVPQGRPKLNVTYTTDPVTVTSFQPGVGGYLESNVTMARVVGNISGSGEATTDGATIESEFLDFPEATVAEQLALVKFSNVFGSGAGQAPADKTVAKGWLVLTMDTASANARSPDTAGVHIMKQNWTTSTLHSSFGATPGLQPWEGDVSHSLDNLTGRVAGSEVWFDVTDYLEGARTNPSSDYGLSVIAKDNDGWQLFFNGAAEATVRPRLVIASQQSAGIQGDYNRDGNTNAADYVSWRKLNSSNEGAYNTWKQHFGSSGTSEPPAAPKTVLNYDLHGVVAAATTSLPATQAAAGTSALPLSFGPGLAAAGLNNGFSAQNWTNSTADGGIIDRSRAIAMGDYIQFGFELDGSHEASLSTLDLSLRRSAANGPMNFEIQVSLDDFATAGTTVTPAFQYRGRTSGSAAEPNPTLTNPFIYMTADTPGRPNAVSSPSDPIPTVDLSSIGLLQDIAPGTTVTFRLFGWGDGAAGAANSNTIGFRVNGPRVTGFVTAASGGSGTVPEPTSAIMAGLFAALLGLRRGQRSSVS
jgi:hypothetical protein